MIGDDDRDRTSDDQDFDSGEGGDRGRRGRGDRGGDSPPPADPLTDDDPKPRETLRGFKISKARAETGKPIEPILEAIVLEDPAHVAATRALETAYANATADNDQPDNLRNQYCDASAAFRETARTLVAKAPRQEWSLLERWIYRNLLKEGAPVRRILIERSQVEDRLRARAGPRELALGDAHARTERWAAAWTAWSDPTKNIGEAIKGYKGRIGELKDLANDSATADKAILEFWFEVAPAHLGLGTEDASEEDAPGIGRVKAALKDFKDVRARLTCGAARNDGSLFLIPAGELPEHREQVLEAWRSAAEAEAEAKADYDLRPDDAAKLRDRHDGLKQDKWLDRAKTILAPPATP